jgi:bifunctional non-homologous end joining protein LigD
MEGVLKSWAVPKGPSVRAEEKRLAVHVEDHPMEYANFEGVIPAGNYGAGSVIVWDRGTYGSFKPEDLREQYVRGKLELELFGHKLAGRWTLVRMSKSEKDWLLLKKLDGAAADVDALERWPRSVICGLTVEEMRDVDAWLAGLREHVAALGAPRGDLRAAKVEHMLATLVERPFSRAGWVFEIKYDGVRVVARSAARRCACSAGAARTSPRAIPRSPMRSALSSSSSACSTARSSRSTRRGDRASAGCRSACC